MMPEPIEGSNPEGGEAMLVSPKIMVKRISQIAPGELFLFDHEGLTHIGLMCRADKSGDKWVLPFDGDDTRLFRPDQMKDRKAIPGGIIEEAEKCVVPLETRLVVRLSTDDRNTLWRKPEPDNIAHCLLAAGCGVYFQGTKEEDGQPCFVNAATGAIEPHPSGRVLYVRCWQIVTNELEPQTILAPSIPKEPSP